MKKVLSIILLAALTLGFGALAEPAGLTGTPVPDFAVTTCDGETLTISGLLADKDLVVLNIFASWCPPCRMEFPEMEAVYVTLSDRMEIVAVSGEARDTDEIISDYRAGLGLTFPMGAANGTGIIEYARLSAYPTTLFIDKSGNLVFYQRGAFLVGTQFKALADYFLSDGYDGTPAVAYNVYVCDQDSNPIPGVYVNFCTDTTCEPRVTDEDGAICFAGKPQSYHLQILKAPEGYSFDADYEEAFDGAGGNWLYVYLTRE